MKLPRQPNVYDRVHEQRRSREIELADTLNVKKGQDIDLGSGSLILTSPNGTRYAITIDNNGNLNVGAGSSFVLLAQFDLATDTLDSGNEAVVTGIDEYDELHVQVFTATVAVSDSIAFQLSDDGGSTWKTGASDYSQDFINSTFEATNSSLNRVAITSGGTTGGNQIQSYATIRFMGRSDVRTDSQAHGAGTANGITYVTTGDKGQHIEKKRPAYEELGRVRDRKLRYIKELGLQLSPMFADEFD